MAKLGIIAATNSEAPLTDGSEPGRTKLCSKMVTKMACKCVGMRRGSDSSFLVGWTALMLRLRKNEGVSLGTTSY